MRDRRRSFGIIEHIQERTWHSAVMTLEAKGERRRRHRWWSIGLLELINVDIKRDVVQVTGIYISEPSVHIE
jgi:hypothetical protein